MAGSHEVADHYTHGSLLDAIRTGVAEIGKTPDNVTIDELGAIDEFHIVITHPVIEGFDQLISGQCCKNGLERGLP